MYILFAVVSLTALGLSLGFLLGAAARYFKVEDNPLVDEIERNLRHAMQQVRTLLERVLTQG